MEEAHKLRKSPVKSPIFQNRPKIIIVNEVVKTVNPARTYFLIGDSGIVKKQLGKKTTAGYNSQVGWSQHSAV